MKLKEIIKDSELVKTGAGERKRPNMIIVWIIIAAIVLLAVSGFSDNEKESAMQTEKADGTEEYVRREEKRLEVILKKINGAGDVSVYISIDNGGEKVLARDFKNKVDENSGEGEHSEENESVVVTSGKSSTAQPYVVEERKPEISGVLVVAEGAASERVRVEIYEAVRAVYGMAAHRIKVTY